MLAGILFVRREIWTLHVFDLSMPHWQEGLLLPLAAIHGGISGSFNARRREDEHAPTYGKFLKFGVPVFFVLYVACAALCERLAKGVFPGGAEIWRAAGLVLVVCGIALHLWAHVTTERPEVVRLQPDSTGRGGKSDEPAAQQGEAVPGEAVPGEAVPAQNQRASGDSAVDAVIEKIAAALPQPTGTSRAAGRGGAAGTAAGSDDQVSGVWSAGGPYRLVRYPDAAGKLLALCGIPLCFNAWLPLLAVPGIVILLKWHISDQESYRISQLGEPYVQYRKHTWHFLPFVY